MESLLNKFLNVQPIATPADPINIPKMVCQAALKANIINQLMPANLKNTSSEALVCAVSGLPIGLNEPMAFNTNRTNVGTSFHDEPDLAARHSQYVSEWGLNMFRGEFLKGAGNAVITEDGFFKFSTAKDIAYWLLYPPTKPFLMVKKTIMNPQHVIWKAPINLSNQIFFIQQGSGILKVNRKNVFKTLDLISNTKNYRGKLDDDSAPKKGKKDKEILYNHPFFSLDSFSKDAMNFAVDHPSLNETGLQMLKNFGYLSIGDLYMVGVALSAQRKPEDWAEVVNRSEPVSF